METYSIKFYFDNIGATFSLYIKANNYIQAMNLAEHLQKVYGAESAIIE